MEVEDTMMEKRTIKFSPPDLSEQEIAEVADVVLVDCLDTVERSYKVEWP